MTTREKNPRQGVRFEDEPHQGWKEGEAGKEKMAVGGKRAEEDNLAARGQERAEEEEWGESSWGAGGGGLL